jgi:hypothetical protein
MDKTVVKVIAEAGLSLAVGMRTGRFRKASDVLCVSAVILCLLLNANAVRADDLTPGYWEQSLLPQTGLATFYAPGMMEYVAGFRQAQGQLPACPECVGTVALLRAGDIGRKVWLQGLDGERVGPFLVIDCARRQDVASLVARNWVVDVSYELGQAWGMDRPLAGVIVLEDPADAGVSPERLAVPTPFYVPPGEVVISAPTATPAFSAAPPTPWPTRVPAGMPTRGPTAEPTGTPAPPTPRLPPPLTPVITTPTPEVTPTPAAQPTQGTPSPEPTAGSETATPAAEATEVSVGRAGGGLLEPASVLTPAPAPVWPMPTASPRPPARTPRPDLAPILPAVGATPVPAAGPESPFIRWWRDVLEQLLP